MKTILSILAGLSFLPSAHAIGPVACGNANILLNCKAVYAIQTSGGGTHGLEAFNESRPTTEIIDSHDTDNDEPCAAAVVLGNDQLSGDPVTGVYFQATYMPLNSDLGSSKPTGNLDIYMLKDGKIIANFSSSAKTFTQTVDVTDNTNLEDAVRSVTYTCSVR